MCSGKWCSRNISTPIRKVKTTKNTPMMTRSTSVCPGPAMNHGRWTEEAGDPGSTMAGSLTNFVSERFGVAEVFEIDLDQCRRPRHGMPRVIQINARRGCAVKITMLLGGADDDGRLDVWIRSFPLALVHRHDCCGRVSLRPHYRSDGLLAAMGDRDVHPVGQPDRALDSCIHRVARREG